MDTSSAAGEHHHVLAGLLRDDLAHAQMGAGFQTLGDGHHDGVLVDVRGHAAAYTAQGEGGAGHDHQLCPRSAGVVAADFQTLGQHGAREPRVAAGDLHFGNQVFVVGPHGYIVSVLTQADGKGGAPCAASDDSSLHCFFPFPNRLVFRSSPLIRRRMLLRCIHTINALRTKPTTMGKIPSPQWTKA